jgi:hypothetical protein
MSDRRSFIAKSILSEIGAVYLQLPVPAEGGLHAKWQHNLLDELRFASEAILERYLRLKSEIRLCPEY